jgi:hypothetical protein
VRLAAGGCRHLCEDEIGSGLPPRWLRCFEELHEVDIGTHCCLKGDAGKNERVG